MNALSANKTLPPWLDRVYERIEQSSKHDVLPHAILMESMPGWGVLDLAEQVSSLILGDEVDFHLDRNVNLKQIKVAEKRRFISIDQVRDSIEFLLSTSVEGSRKLVVFQFVERMSIPASQALLKILEEPPARKHLLLITCNSALLMPTIRSRCQRFFVSPGNEKEVQDYLESKNIEADQSQNYASDFGGAPYAILDAIRDSRVCVRDVLAGLSTQKTSPITAVKQLRAHGEIDELLRSWQYVTHRFAENTNSNKLVVAFYDQLTELRRQFLEVPGLDAETQLLRMCLKWQELSFKLRAKSRRRRGLD